MRLLEGAIANKVDPDAAAHFYAMAGTDDQERYDLNNLILGLKADGIWSKIDVLNVLHQSEADTLLDIRGNSNATVVGSPVFDASDGFDAFTASDYVNTNFTPSTDGVKCVGDDNHFFVFFSKDETDVQNWHHNGARGADSNYLHIATRFEGLAGFTRASCLSRSECAIATNASIVDTGFENFQAITRETAAGQTAIIKDQNTYALNDSTDTLPEIDMYIGCYNNNGTPTVDALNNEHTGISAWGMGGGLSTAEAEALRTRITTYMTSIGATQ